MWDAPEFGFAGCFLVTAFSVQKVVNVVSCASQGILSLFSVFNHVVISSFFLPNGCHVVSQARNADLWDHVWGSAAQEPLALIESGLGTRVLINANVGIEIIT